MENTNKMNRLTNDLRVFDQLMNENRIRKQNLEIESKTDFRKEDLRDPSEILEEVSKMIIDMTFLLAKAILRVKYLEEQYFGGGERAGEPCGDCPSGVEYGSSYGTVVLVARPDGYNTIMNLDELSEEIGEIAFNKTVTYDVNPVPGTEDLYYTIPEKKPLKRGGKTYYKAPAVIFGIDEEAGEVVSPNARQLYTAARYFEEASGNIRTREGDTAVFCFD